MKKIGRLVMYLSLVLFGTGCAIEMNQSADEIMTNILESSTEINEYYAEGKMIVREGDNVIEEANFKEFVHEDGRRRLELEHIRDNNYNVTVRTEDEIINYDESSNTAIIFEIDSMDLPHGITQREQVTRLLGATKDTHEREIVGEEEVNGFNTYHMVLKANKNNSLFGDMEIWVDQKTWFMIKTTSVIGDTYSEAVYTLIDYSPSFSDEIFAIDLPDDVKIESIDDYVTFDEGDLKEAEQLLGQDFYMFDVEELNLDKIEIFRSELHDEVTLHYSIDGFPSFMLSIFPAPEGTGMEITSNERTIRGLPTEIDIIGDSHFFLWDEEGLRYSLIVENPEVSKEQIISYTEKMKQSTE